MIFALDFVLGLILGAAITALAAMALFSYREYQRETAAEIEKLSKRLNETQIKAEQLRRPDTPEGLILQGCGGDLQEWVTGINDMLTEENILLDGSRFEQASVFEHQGLTNLFLPFDDVKLDMGKLAIWRLNTREQFGSMWCSDYVDNRLGGPLEENAPAQKPDCPLIGQNGNIFNLMGIASRTLKEHGMEEQAREMRSRIMESGSYDKALVIIGDYVNITSIDETDEDFEEGMDMDL